jgi:hypothetical protein
MNSSFYIISNCSRIIVIKSVLRNFCVAWFRYVKENLIKSQTILSLDLFNYHLNEEFIYSIIIYYIIILDMFRAIPCSSSGGQIVLLQHLVSSHSVSSYSVHRLRTHCSPLSTGALNGWLTIPGAVTIKFDLLKMTMVLLETCRGL